MRSLPWVGETLAVLFAVLSLPAVSDTHTDTQSTDVITRIGSYKSPGGKCPISLRISAQGGFTQLLLPSEDKRNHIVNDATGAGYLSNKLLAYTVPSSYRTFLPTEHSRVTPRKRSRRFDRVLLTWYVACPRTEWTAAAKLQQDHGDRAEHDRSRSATG